MLAFEDYPLVRGLFPQAQLRQKTLPYWAGYPLHYATRYGLVYVTSAVEGVAAWIGAAHADMSIPSHLEAGFLSLPFKVRLGTFRRMMAVEEFMEKRWALAAPKRRWYLWIMGVRPEVRGRGMGASLIEAGTRQADVEGLPCCLETHNLDKVSYYGHFGFETIFKGPLPGHELSVYMMMRPPLHSSHQ